MSSPIIWIIFPILISVFLMIFRKNRSLQTLLQVGFCFLFVLIAAITRFEQVAVERIFSIMIPPEFSFLGRSFLLNETYRFTIMMAFGFLGVWTITMYLLDQSSFLVPFGLAFNALLLAALSVEPFLYSAFIIVVAAIICLPILTKPENSRLKGLSRFLFFMTLGMPFILLAGWYLAGGEISPINDEQLLQSTLLLGLGFVLWLAVFPFHSWVPMVTDEMESLDGVYILILLPVIIFLLLIKYLNGFSWLRDFPLIYDAIRLFGIIMVFSSSLWAVFQTKIRKIIGYMLICSMGVILLSLSLDASEGVILSSHFIFPRLLSFLLVTVSLVVLEVKGRIYTIRDLRSAFYSFPLSTLGLLIGLFSLTGMPITIGFAPMQSLYAMMSAQNQFFTLMIAISMAIASILLFRITYLVFIQDDQEAQNLEILLDRYLILAILIIFVICSMIPSLIFPQFSNLVSGFDFLVK